MCHSFETYDPKIAIREVEARLTAPGIAFPTGWIAALCGVVAGWWRAAPAPREEVS